MYSNAAGGYASGNGKHVAAYIKNDCCTTYLTVSIHGKILISDDSGIQISIEDNGKGNSR